MDNISKFFEPITGKLAYTSEDYLRLQPCIDLANAMARTTNQSIYIIDYHQKNFLYVSNNPLFLCGKTAEEVKSMGYGFYLSVVPEEEVNMLLEINEAGFDFFYRQPSQERLDLMIEYDFHLTGSDGNSFLIHHKLTPFLLNENCDIWLGLSAVSLSTATQSGNVVMTDLKKKTHFEYSFELKKWKEVPHVELSDREIDVLRLSIKGLSNNAIAEQMFVDVNTVKYHRKNLLQKLHAENITEAIFIATNLRLI